MADYVLKEIRKMVIFDQQGQPVFASMYEHLREVEHIFSSEEEITAELKELEKRQAEEKIQRGIQGQMGGGYDPGY